MAEWNECKVLDDGQEARARRPAPRGLSRISNLAVLGLRGVATQG